MANWFKIYETDLDEKRLKYALSKIPEVGWVFIGILSECCKHRSDTIRWSDNEIDLFGFSDALKVSIPKLNAAISLLQEINYIEKGVDTIRVIKWNDKQSEYNHRKARGDYRRDSDTSGGSPLEERRGEEKRSEAPCSPPVVEKAAGNGTGEETDGVGDMNKLRKRLYALFKRKENAPPDYSEEHGMALVIRRPDWLTELNEIECYRNAMLPERIQYDWPRYLGKLVDNWAGTLDKARESESPKAGQAKVANKFLWEASKNGKPFNLEYDAVNAPYGKQFTDGKIPTGLQMSYDAWLKKWKAQNP